MESAHATIDANGQLVLPDEAKVTLGVPSGGEVEILVRESCVELRPKRKPFSKEEFDRDVAEIHKLFGRKPGEPSLEDDLYTMRREEEEHSRRKYGC